MAELDTDIAVAIKGAYKQYHSSAKILKGLTMTVRKGTIYGLLGASGCGKTTLLSCIVGKNSLDAGSIKLCIKERSRLGFMPQELSLFEEFTIEETFFYYGRVYSLPVNLIENQIVFLTSLLQLPAASMLISSMSGGQKRRVSFATALLPSPDILILDEPTVGQDSLLRYSIWEHLVKIAAENTTIIITTHYVEEARQANAVGFMYDGILLAEDAPTQFLTRFECSSLEDVFLHLCHRQVNEKKTNDEPVRTEDTMKPFKKNDSLSYSRIVSQWIKNYLYIKKNFLPVFVFIVILPILQVIILSTCVGNTPYDVPVSVVNLEINGSCLTESYDGDCNRTLGCRFIERLPVEGLLIKHYANHMIPETVGKNSDRWASIIIPEGFTEAINERFNLGFSVPEDILNKSFINIFIDNSNNIVADHIYSAIFDSFKFAMESWYRDCGWPAETFQMPIKYNDPIYGRTDITFLDFMAPGILCIFAFLCPLVFSMGAILYEKITGTMDRSLIAGVLWSEFILAHISIAISFVAVQVALMMYITFQIRDIYYNGSLVLIFLLLLAQGFCGVGAGIFLGVVFNNEAAALNYTNGFSFGLTFLTGVLWPVEGMHWIAYYLRYIIPISIPIDSIRSVVVFGQTIGSFSVAVGFIVTLGWTVFFVLMSIVLMDRKNL